MLSIQDFRNAVGEYSKGYLRMDNAGQANATLSKVANHRTFTILNPSEANVHRRLGGAAAQNIRAALKEAIVSEYGSQACLLPTIRSILYGDENPENNVEYATTPLSRRDVRQMIETLDHAQFEARSLGTKESPKTISDTDLQFVNSELYRVKDGCKSAYVKAVSLLLPKPQPGAKPKVRLSFALCALIAEKSEALYKAFLGKSDDAMTDELLWKTIFDEKIPENAYVNKKGGNILLAQAMINRIDEKILSSIDSHNQEDPDNLVKNIRDFYITKGLTFSGALKGAAHPEQIVKADIVPGATALRGEAYDREGTVLQIAKDANRVRSLSVEVVCQYRSTSGTLVTSRDEVRKLPSNANVETSRQFCNDIDSLLQHSYARRVFNNDKGLKKDISSKQVDAILAFCRQESDNLLVYPGCKGIVDKRIFVRANRNGTMDVLVSGRNVNENENTPTRCSVALCRVDSAGNTTILDLALAQDPTKIDDMFLNAHNASHSYLF